MKHLACLALLLCAGAAFGAERLKIDFRYNTAADDGGNFLRWRTSGVQADDRFDAVTGASVAQSTKGLRAVQADGGKTFPKGLYALLLFAVSPAAQAQTDGLTVTQDGARLSVAFMHRGVAYRICTDEQGRLDPRSSFSLAEGLADNTAGVFTIKPEFLYDTADETTGESARATGIDWEKVTFVPDSYGEGTERVWDGALSMTFVDGVLTIRGTLKRIAAPEMPAPQEEASEDSGEAAESAETDTEDNANATGETTATFTSETERGIIDGEIVP